MGEIVSRVGIRGGYSRSGHSSKEVAPVSPIAPIRHADEDTEDAFRDKQGHKSKDRLDERRLHAMRHLIDELRKDGDLERLDYLDAEREMKGMGIELLQQGLQAYLQLLGGAADAAGLVQEYDHRLEFARGREVRAFHNTELPVRDRDLFELNLVLRDLPLPPAEQTDAFPRGFIIDGPIAAQCENVSISLRPSEPGEESPADAAGILAELSTQVGVMELDDDGRRIYLYQRPDNSYGFYADKHIDLSI